MGTFFHVDPDKVRATGAKFRALGESLRADLSGIANQIIAIDSTKPEGSDSFGEEYAAQYNQMTENGQTVSQNVKSRMTNAGKQLERVGGKLIQAMDEYQRGDEESGKDIRSTLD